MANVFFYCLVVLIWGTTWIAVKFQLGTVAPELSIAYRFGLAAILLLCWCRLRRLSLRFKKCDLAFIALQGLCLFSLSYLLFYIAQKELTSGLAAVVFSTMVILNIINGRLFLGKPMEMRVLVGGLLGLCGLCLLFWSELTISDFSFAEISNLLLAFVATYIASLGNIVSARNLLSGLPIVQINTLGMAFGALFMFVFAIFSGAPLIIELSWPYLLSLGYLALFGSVIAFGCYISLIGRIGAGRAAYTTLLFPVVALTISTKWEGYHWTMEAFAGVIIIMLGNGLAIYRMKAGYSAQSPGLTPQAQADKKLQPSS